MLSNVATNYRNFSRRPQKHSKNAVFIIKCLVMRSKIHVSPSIFDAVNNSNHFNVSSTVTLNSVHTESGIGLYQHNFDEQIDEEQ